MTDAANTTHEAVHRSPPLGALALVNVVLFLGSLATIAMMTGGAAYPRPYSSIAEAQAYDEPIGAVPDQRGALPWSAWAT
jgi:hypothetical protein